MSDPDDGPEIDRWKLRPYLLTSGRTRSLGDDLAVEALVVTRSDAARDGLTPEQALILESCSEPLAIAEIAAVLAVPIGVARVLVSDLAHMNDVDVCDTADQADVDLVRRLLAGVRAI